MLVVEGLSRSYPAPGGAREVLRAVSFSLAAGDSLAVTGPSGSGKTTLLLCLGALERPDAGTVRLGGVDLGALDDEARAQARSRRIGFVFQEHRLLPSCTVLENVLLPALAAGEAKAREADARELVAQVGLADRADAFPSALSGGERQRAAVARALLMRPQLLLCDEPTGQLDRKNEDAVGELLTAAAARGAAVVAVTHNLRFAARFARRAGLAEGRLDAPAA